MRLRSATLLGVVLVGGCLVPQYEAEPLGTSGRANAAGSANAGSANAGGSTAGATATECTSNQKICEGKCVDIDDVNYGCTDTSCNMSACPAAGTATLACEAGACVIGDCGPGSKKCAGRCVAISDPTFGCGETSCDDSSCPDPESGTLVCDAGTCTVGTCGPDTKQCGNKCVPLDENNGCSDPDDCNACASYESCLGTPATCACKANDTEACKSQVCGTAVNNCMETVDCRNWCEAPTPVCSDNACVECNVAADCPSVGDNVCAVATCIDQKCGYTTASKNTACPGGTCSSTQPGICIRPPVNAGTVSIDATEVTNGQYYEFMKAKGSDTSGQPSACTWNNDFTPAFLDSDEFKPEMKYYDYPVVGVDWCDAYAYCKWAGRRLCGKIGGGAVAPFGDSTDPTKGQWMRACAGTSNFVYPYGNDFVDNRCNTPHALSAPAAVASHPECVGAYPGLYDMSGNASEWLDACDGTTASSDQCAMQGGAWSPFADLPAQTSTRCEFAAYSIRATGTSTTGIRCCGP